jgi:uncharacterized protein (TIGR02646 family)
MMRPIERGKHPKVHDGNDVTFAKYNDARDHLIDRIGDYCSYCEVCLHGPIHVEHVRPKKPQPALELTWSNLLLGCTTCNSIKGDKDVDLTHYLWPDRDNTARAFNYDHNLPPYVAPGLSPAIHAIAEATIKLTGLNRIPGHAAYSDRDRRWKKRLDAWGIALLARQNLGQNDTPRMRQMILQNAIAIGFWSVWLQVFHDDLDMRLALIKWFPGTASDCFDSDAQPLPRSGGIL